MLYSRRFLLCYLVTLFQISITGPSNLRSALSIKERQRFFSLQKAYGRVHNTLGRHYLEVLYFTAHLVRVWIIIVTVANLAEL
jgi:hypothetical protein